MPLSGKEPSHFPEDLFALAQEPCGLGPWWVVHTKPRAEKALARLLYRRRKHFFLPVSEKKWRNGDRWFRSYIPVFPGYVFIHGPEPEVVGHQERSLVARVLHVPDPAELQANLAQVHRLLCSGLTPRTEKVFEPGALVEVLSGPLAGLKGKVLRRGNRWTFLVEVQFLQCGVSVELDASMIQRQFQGIAC